MGIGNPNWEGYLAYCPNCGGTKKEICEYISCWCSDWTEDDWFTNQHDEAFILELWTGHDNDE
jgi:hypothetical protein